MKTNKVFTRIIIITLLVTLLTFNVGRVYQVKAIGATIAGAAAATFCAVGIAYCSYMLLTGAVVHVPDAVSDVQDWLVDMGKKVAQYPSGRAAYEEIYPQLLRDPSAALIHDFLDSEVWTWTSDKLKLWANDFSNTDVMAQIAAYNIYTTNDLYPTNGYSYTITADFPTDIYTNWYSGSIQGFIENVGQFYVDTAHLVYYNYGFGRALIAHTDINANVRNLRIVDNDQYKYVPEYLDGTTWQPYSSLSWRNGYIFVNGYYYDVALFSNGDIWRWQQNSNVSISSSDQRGIVMDYPLFPDAVIHDEITDTDLPMVDIPTDVQERVPEWPDIPVNDGDEVEYPIVPYVELPLDPNWVNPTGGPNGGGNWGFNLDDLLDLIEELSGLLIEIGTLGELINRFKTSLNGTPEDTYYIYYDDSINNTNYFEYYTITNYGGDTYVYDIDVSQVDEHLPVDLNTIQTYTSNRYLNTIKQSASGIGSVIGEWFAFWHNCDAEIVYVILGAGILTIIAAFIGKWGHS